MAHCIHAIIGAQQAVEDIIRRFPESFSVQLVENWAAVPATEEFLDRLDTEYLVPLLCEVSRIGPVAYVETDYFLAERVPREELPSWTGSERC